MSSTAMATATGTSSAAGAANTCATPNVYDIPTSDVACAVPAGGNHTEVMSGCCRGADVVSYGGGCGLYCLAQGQAVDDLTACLFAGGIPWQDAFCRGEGNATASATGNSAPTASGASVVGGASKTSGGAPSPSSSAGDAESGAAAAAPAGGVGALGAAVGGLLLSSLVLGVFRL
ncbi:hypothetical protein KVR01_007226 [Diaporthe batatas]|uniref:uncharacterized protein n=1 Tax=Diaporthe batatas TaxID=748121 RepID=UPI001D04DEBB|nr:uncharacterized protein KVR01_007226 [Diaporthe batatas]KAG8162748.1 hypothetical protein KVR01_007226 [Diaporthe batatas]